MDGNNLFKIESIQQNKEDILPLFSNNEILIERIVSFGQVTSEGTWLEQEKAEWVALLQGEAEILFEKDNNKVTMKSGDHILIPSHCRHRVTYTSKEPACIWLAVHFNENGR